VHAGLRPDRVRQAADQLCIPRSVMSSTAVGWLEQLPEVTAADELIITRITHDYAGRIRSYRLLAEERHRLGQL
jgi:hypothetical protein